MIYIVRHGQTDWNLEGRYQGRIDIDINAEGIKQAENIKQQLKDIKFDIVFSSPLKRAYNTAKIICDNNIIIDERIIERCNGELEGKLKTEIEFDIDFNNLNENRLGIETIGDFRNRINNFFEEIENNYKNKNILIVTHAGVGIYAKCFFEGEPLNRNYKSYKLKNGEILKYSNKNNEKKS